MAIARKTGKSGADVDQDRASGRTLQPETVQNLNGTGVGSLASGVSLFEYGSAWVRADFHMHTLADKEFSYSRASNYFLSDYVAALKSADIRVAVITNHNKFDRDEFKALAKV